MTSGAGLVLYGTLVDISIFVQCRRTMHSVRTWNWLLVVAPIHCSIDLHFSIAQYMLWKQICRTQWYPHFVFINVNMGHFLSCIGLAGPEIPCKLLLDFISVMQYTMRNPLGDPLIISNYHNLQTTNYVNTSISNSNDNTVFIDPGHCM